MRPIKMSLAFSVFPFFVCVCGVGGGMDLVFVFVN